LEKEIAAEQQLSKNDEAHEKNLQIKQALLATYQAQLAELEQKAAEATSA